MQEKISERDRFWSGVQIGDPTECWPWKRSTSHGYGQMMIDGKMQRTHRVAWVMTGRTIPAGMFLCHKCDNPICCNPDHLFVGSHRDNVRDSISKGRFNRNKARVKTNGRSKLSEESVKQIRALYKPRKFGMLRLARMFGVTHQGIAYVLKEGWKHIS